MHRCCAEGRICRLGVNLSDRARSVSDNRDEACRDVWKAIVVRGAEPVVKKKTVGIEFL